MVKKVAKRKKIEEHSETFVKNWDEKSLAKIFGYKLNISDPKVPILSIPKLKSWQRGGVGTKAANGGIIAATVDFSLGLLGMIYLPKGRKGTASFSVDFIKPLTGKSLISIGKVEKYGSSMLKGIVEIYNDQNELCALGKGRVLLLESSDTD